MKNSTLTSLVLLASLFSYAQDVTIPDVKFKNAIIAQGVDTNNDSIIQVSEALAVTKLKVYAKSITNLTGIEAFTNLTYLACDTNKLTSLDVSALVKLDTFLCNNNPNLPSVNVSTFPNLSKFNCALCKITSMDITANKNLEWFDIGGNVGLTSMDVSQNTELTLIDIVYCPNLTSFDISNNLKLQTLYAAQTTKLLKLDVSANTALTTLLLSPNFFPKAAMTICVSETQMASIPSGWMKASIDSYSTTACLPVDTEEFSKKQELKTLLRIYNLLGEEVNSQEAQKGVLIYEYSDGSYEKRATF
jgi:hypothetical protein